MYTFDEMLADFEPVSLSDIDQVRLMDRVDTKFLFHEKELMKILEMMQPHYRVLEVNHVRNSRYETRYLDTADFAMFHSHLHGKFNRYKIRYRSYPDSGTSFIETKCKTNKGRTIKKRMEVNELGEGLNEPVKDFAERLVPYPFSSLNPALHVSYSRITMVHRDFSERLTIDTGLRFSTPGKRHSLSGLTIAEIKRGVATHAPFERMLHSLKINPFSISKYCTGVCLLADGVRKNNYKYKILRINKILQIPNEP